jgi:Family of unknown function (DUF6188)
MQRFGADGPWDLEVVGFEVQTVNLNQYSVDIIAYGDEGHTAQLRLAGPIELLAPSGKIESLETGKDSWERLAALLVLRQDRVTRAQFNETSELRVEFQSGHTITAACEGQFETWEVNASGGVKVIGTPGANEPAIWSGDPKYGFARSADGQWRNGHGELLGDGRSADVTDAPRWGRP